MSIIILGDVVIAFAMRQEAPQVAFRRNAFSTHVSVINTFRLPIDSFNDRLVFFVNSSLESPGSTTCRFNYATITSVGYYTLSFRVNGICNLD